MVRELDYCADAEWYVLCSDSALGCRGTSEATENMLKFGPPTGGVPNTDPYSDKQVGVFGVEGDIGRARRCDRVFRTLTPWDRAVILHRYSSFRCPAGARGALGDLAGVVALNLANRRRGERVKGALLALERARPEGWGVGCSELQAAAQNICLVTDWEPEMSRVCQSTDRDSARTRGKWLVEAKGQVRAAHASWVGIAAELSSAWAKVS